MRTRVSSKGQIVLPVELRDLDGIRPGQQFDVERLDAGDYRLTRIVLPESHRLVDWLRACPEKDWFEPIASESTDTL